MFGQGCVRALRIAGLWMIAATAAATVAAGQAPEPLMLGNEERAWIDRHPVVRVGVIEDLQPIEYMENGQLKGLSAEYLDAISRKTGLRFDHTPYKRTSNERFADLLGNKLDMLSAVRINGAETIDPRIAHTSVYLNTTAVVVTRKRHAPVSEIGGLNGMAVTLSDLERFKDVISAKAPGARLIEGGAALKMLQQVASGEADAAVATEAYLLPFLYRDFQDQLQVSGVLTEITTEVAMSMLAEPPMLHAIVRKAMASMTSEEVRSAHANWLKQHAPSNPSLAEITDHYPHEVALLALILALLVAAVFQTHRLRQRAENKEQEKTIFLAVMSHEIRSLMNAVLAAVELLRNTRLDPQQQHLAHLANSGSSTLLALVNDLLDVSKLEANQGWVECGPVNIATLVRDAVDLHLLRANEKHISLTWQGDSAPPLLMLDDIRVGQILRNLISNAIKFTDTGGVKVGFSISDTDTAHQKRLQVVVADTGVGISQESQKSLFEPYVQARSTYKRTGGTGLGMFICRELLKLMQGTISLSSETGKGTRIEFSLPAKVAEAAVPAPVAQGLPAQAGTSQRSLRILVVEDTAINQAVLKEQIEAFGCTPVVAQDATRAVACFEQETYDLVLMDCDLPDQDGYALTALLRIMENDAGQPRCPIIATSASTDAKHVSRCFDSGMDGVLSKPLSLGKLQETIELWCGITLTLAPGSITGKVAAERIHTMDALEKDLHALLEAVALNDVDAARHAAHRLLGGALSVEWPAVARAARHTEDLLRAAALQGEAPCMNTLQALVRDFRTTTFSDPVSVQPRAPEFS